VIFKTATEWVAFLADAQREGRLDEELRRLERIPQLVCDEVGYIPFDPQAASLMFMLVSRRYERASLIVNSNKPFSAWGEIFGDELLTAPIAHERESARTVLRSPDGGGADWRWHLYACCRPQRASRGP
jgi:DNA replication protein DnaC